MMKKVFLAAVLLFVSVVSSPAETVTRIAAVVNDEIITTFQLEREVERVRSQKEGAGEVLSEDDQKTLRKTILGRLIEESLMRQRVEELGLQVSDDEVEQAIIDVERQNRLTREQLVEALAQQGLEFSEYKENLRKQILRFKLLGREVNAKVDVTIPEIEAYYSEHIDDYRGKPFVRLSRLSFYFPPDASAIQKGHLYDRALKAQGQLVAGADLDSVLKEAKPEGMVDGGDMGTFGEGELIPRFDEAVQDLEVGGVTPVIETPTGYHVLIVTERSAGKVEPLENLRAEIEAILKEKKTEERFKEWSTGLKEKAFIDIRP